MGTIPRLLIESALAPRDSTPMYDRRELLAELFALSRLLAGAATNLNHVARVANATGAVPVLQLEVELEWLRRVAGPGGRLDEVIERVAETARAGRVDVARQ